MIQSISSSVTFHPCVIAISPDAHARSRGVAHEDTFSFPGDAVCLHGAPVVCPAHANSSDFAEWYEHCFAGDRPDLLRFT